MKTFLKIIKETMKKKVSIVIVTWNAKDFLKQCLYSIHRETKNLPFEIMVVDNASTDGTSEMVKKEFSEVELIENEKNLGFAKANNMAIRKILDEKKSDYILLLNSDTVIQEQAIERMILYLENNPSVGAVAPALILPDRRFQTGAAGYLPSALTGFNYFFFLFKLFPENSKALFIEQSYFSKKKEPVNVDWLSGACLAIKREIVEKVGLMNEAYFFYLDDIDWGRRMKQSNVLLHYLSGINVLHFHGITYKRILKEINTRWLMMLYQYVRRERGQIEYILFRFFSIGGFLLRFILYVFIYFLNRDDYLKEKIRENYCFFIFSSTGKGKKRNESIGHRSKWSIRNRDFKDF